MTIQDVVNYTNLRINNWYNDVKKEYGVEGSGKASYDEKDSSIVVEYNENGEAKTWKMAFYPEYTRNGIGWVFNCWAELA